MTLLLKLLYLWAFALAILFIISRVTPDGKTKKYLWRGVKSAFIVCLVLAFFNLYIFMFFKDTAFAAPIYLLFLIPVLIFAVVYPALGRFYTPSLNYNLASVPNLTYGARIAKYACFILNIAAIVLLIIAFARPRDISMTELPPTEGVDIILTLDTSGSMGQPDFNPNRLTAAKTAAEDFIKKRTTDRIGIVVFATEAMLQCPPTLDYDSLLGFLDDVHVGIVRANNTAIGDAITVSASHLEGSQSKSKVIILITDGESNEGIVPPVTAAKAAAALGIKIYTIAIISQQEQISFASGQLREIAAVTGAKYYRATNTAELTKIYNDINELEKTQYKDLTVYNYTDRYHPFLILAALLLTLSFILSKTIFVRIP